MNKKEKLAWRDSIAQHRAWNEAVRQTRIRDAGKKSVRDKWGDFMAIMDFGLKIKPRPSRKERQRKLEMLNHYYRRMHRFEMRRSQLGRFV